MDIEGINLSVRAYNAVKRFGINTAEELAERIDEFCNHSPKLGEEAREALNNMELPQTRPSAIVESAEYTKAVSLTRRIKANALAAQESLWEVCKDLKEVRNGKLYKELGYQNFDTYCKSEVGLTPQQGRKYAAIAGLDELDHKGEKGKSTFSFEVIGTEKLYLLARLDEPQREQIQQTVDVEEVSVKELKAKISELEKHKSKLIDDLKNAYDERDKERGYREELVDENGKMSDRISELIAQVDELEARPVEAIAKPDDELVKQHLKEIDDMQREHKEKMNELRSTYEKQMKKGIEEAKKNAQVPDIGELWRALDTALDNAIEAIEDFFDDYEDHPKIKSYANALKKTVRDLNTTVNNVLVRE